MDKTNRHRPNEEMHGKQTSCPKCELEFRTMLHPFCQHHECAVRDLEDAQNTPKPADTQPSLVDRLADHRDDAFQQVVQEARRVWMDEFPCEAGHDHVTPFDRFLYGNRRCGEAQPPACPETADACALTAGCGWAVAAAQESPEWLTR